jgi:hypothetical protein
MPAAGLGLISQATVRICDANGDRLGQGLCVPLEGGTILVLTCNHVVSRATDHRAIPLTIFSSEDHELRPATASYCLERSDPHHDIAVLTIVNESIDVLPPNLVPLSTNFPIPVDVVGIIRPKGGSQRFNAQLAHATPLSVQVDTSTVTIPRLWRLIDTNDVRPGISGSPIIFDNGVIGLTHFARAETADYSREGYVVPIESWFEKNPELAAFSKPYEPQRNLNGGFFAGLPYDRNWFFTGRDAFLKDLHAALRDRDRVAISGLGGVGKTHVASEYAYRHGHEYEAIFWVGAESESTLSAGFVDIARILNLPQRDAQDQSEAVGAAKRWLESHTGWLLIVDNADEPDLLKGLLPRTAAGRVLITSRAQRFDMLGITLSLDIRELPPDEALHFLLKRTGRDDAQPEERDAAADLAHELGCLPLALEQAAAYIAVNQSRFADYLDSYRRRRLTLLERGIPITGDPTKSVTTTWHIAFERIEQKPAAADLLRTSAFLAPDHIPLELLTNGAAQLGTAIANELADPHEPLAIDELLTPLTRYSLIRREHATQSYSLHRLVQEVVREALDPTARQTWAQRVLAALASTFPDPNDHINWPYCERITPHTLLAAHFIEQHDLASESAALLLIKTAFYLNERARYADAEPLLQRAL